MKIIIKNIVYATVSLLTLGACSDSEFEKINTDPNRPANVPTPSIILAAQKQLVDNIRNENFSLRGAQLFAQYYSQNIYTDQSRYDIPRSYADDYWADAYKALNNLNKVIQLNTDEQTKAIAAAGTAGTNANQSAISRVLKAFTFHSLTDVFGDIPYESYGNNDPDFEALQQDPDNYTPKYAPQQKIYADLLHELKQAADTLWKYRDLTTFGASDIIYKGNNELWARFANSLRLRVATRFRAKEPELAVQHIEEAIAQGVFTSNAHNAVFRYAANAPNEAPLYRATVTANRKDFALSHVLVNALKGILGPFDSEDPRLAVYALPNAAGNYIGQPYGLPLEAGGINGPTDISLPGTVVNAPDFGETLQEYAEVAFLIAEYRDWSDAEYRSGVQASLEKWGITATEAKAYAADLPPASRETVLTQKYFALFTQGLEAWSEIRRTGYPAFLVKPNDIVWERTTANGTTTYRFDPIFGDGIPQRLFYPAKEQSVNRTNYQNALANQGDDVITTKVWWNR